MCSLCSQKKRKKEKVQIKVEIKHCFLSILAAQVLHRKWANCDWTLELHDFLLHIEIMFACICDTHTHTRNKEVKTFRLPFSWPMCLLRFTLCQCTGWRSIRPSRRWSRSQTSGRPSWAASLSSWASPVYSPGGRASTVKVPLLFFFFPQQISWILFHSSSAQKSP